MISAVNPAIIKWARERSGLSIDDLARLMKRDPEEVQKWEDGDRSLSYTALEDLAYRHFKTEVSHFFSGGMKWKYFSTAQIINQNK